MKSKWYFPISHMMYSSVNSKGRKIQDFCEDYINVLIDEKSMKEFVGKVKEICKFLDIENPKTIPFTVQFNKVHLEKQYRLEVYQSNDPDKTILFMDFTEVRQIEHYQTEIDFEKGTKK